MKYHLVETSPTGEVRLYRGKLIIGMLRHKSYKQDAYGEFLGTMLRFRRKGFFDKYVTLLDIEGNRSLGSIHFQEWGKKVVIEYMDKVYEGYLDNAAKEWVIDNPEEGELAFRCPSSKSNEVEFELNYMEPAVVLATFYVRRQYRLYRYIASLLLVVLLGILGFMVTYLR